MDGFSLLDYRSWHPDAVQEHPVYAIGNAAAWLSKTGAAVSVNHYLSGRLYVSKSGWLLLSVPNALVRGVFDAMNTPGAELPLAGTMNVPDVKPELLNAHISVMTAEEVKQIGKDKINERGHHFHYALGPIREITPKNIDGISRVWAIQVASPELAALRKSYGLPPLPHSDHQFHITVAVRRANVLKANDVSKFDTAASRGELKAAADHSVTYDCCCSGPCQCPDTCTCKKTGLCGKSHKDAAVKDVLSGGVSDHKPDSTFDSKALAEGAKHEHEHTDQNQVAKEIAKDHLSEDPEYYEKVKLIEKDSASVYADQVQQQFNPFRVNGPILYDHNKPVFENIKDQLFEAKRRGDHILRAQRNQRIWRASLDPKYRYNLALEAFRGETPRPSYFDQAIERYGDQLLATLPGGAK